MILTNRYSLKSECCVKVEGGNGLFSTEILRWYLEHGLVITKIYEVFESCAGKPFDAYISKVVEDRKQGDKALMDKQTLLQHLKDNPNTPQVSVASIKRRISLCDEAIMLGNRAKVDMNSFYGKLLENKSKQEDCLFTRGFISSCIEASKPGLKRHIQVDEEGDMFEIRRCKRVINYDTPSYLGLMVLQNAKLHMLKFVYDFLYRWVDHTKVQACQMDTDSFYISISGDCLEDCLKDNPDMTDDEWVSMVEEFREECEKYLVSEKHDNARTPGFFKLEWEGERMVCLSSKTYAGDGGDGVAAKISAKGVQTNLNTDLLTTDTFLKVQQTGKCQNVRHAGFRMSNHITGGGRCLDDNSSMSTYKGTKRGLNPSSMLKRKLYADGSTLPHKRPFIIEQHTHLHESYC